MSENQGDQPRRRAPIGPTLPPHMSLPKNTSSKSSYDSSKRSRSRSPESQESTSSRKKEGDRESWMTEMPESKLRVDPLNLKNRQFITKRADSTTTERQKSEDERLEEQRQAEYIREYNRQHRPEALVDVYKREFREERVVSKEKDLEERKFDWERDMNQGTKAGSSKNTAEMLSKYGNINSRFSSGSSSKRFL